MYCHNCGKEVEEGAQYCRHCGEEQQPTTGAFTGLKRFTGKVVEKGVNITGRAVRAAKPVVKKGYVVTKSAVKEVAKETKKGAKKLQDKE
ncbi:MAG: zinc ribbon domain-containing protein [Thermoplasmata archaeon]|nr:zinc ribbon domain-containing protein [Thermoplasmata archaeon]